MADLRAEQIVAAVLTTLQGTVTAGANTVRGQLYPSYDAQLPGIALYMGADEVIEEYNQAFFDWELNLKFQIRVETGTNLEQTISTIRKEIHAAIMANPTFGLVFVHDTTPGFASEPELNGDGETPVGIQDLLYKVIYRTSRNDLSA